MVSRPFDRATRQLLSLPSIKAFQRWTTHMDHHPRGRNTAVLWALILLGIAYSSLLYYGRRLTGTDKVDGIIGVLLGLYICSHPAANVVDLLFFRGECSESLLVEMVRCLVGGPECDGACDRLDRYLRRDHTTRRETGSRFFVDVKRRLLRSHPPSDDSQKVRSGDENWQGLIVPL